MNVVAEGPRHEHLNPDQGSTRGKRAHQLSRPDNQRPPPLLTLTMANIQPLLSELIRVNDQLEVESELREVR